MSPWAKRILIATMVLWTAFTAAAGWYAFRADSTPAVANGHVAEPSGGDPPIQAAVVPSPTRSAQPTRTLGENMTEPAGVASASTSAGGAGTATGSFTPGRQAPPAHSGDAVGDLSAGSLDSDGPHNRPATNAGRSKGVIVLDPGHGRGDPGAVHHLPDGTVDITEADSNLRNAELIRDNLVALGYEVYLTREGEGQGPVGPIPLQFITSDLYARVGLAKAVDAQLYLAIHGNGAVVPSISGPETWYCGRHEEAAANEKLARVVQQAMMDGLHEYGYFPPDRGIKEDAQSHHSGDFCQFVVTRETPVPAALLEFLFLTNDDDARVLVDDRAHVLMAKHVADALDAFMQERSVQH